MRNATWIGNNLSMPTGDVLIRNSHRMFVALRFNPLILVLSLAAITPVQAGADANPYPTMAPVTQYMMDRDAEITLARTAAPATVSDKAEILVLGTHGFETAVKGSNGFVCFVGRSWAQDFDAPEFWNPNIHTPQCWNAAAVSSYLPEYLKRTQWVLAGVSKDEMLARTKAAWASHEFGPPTPVSMVYMMSKQQYINDSDPPSWYPHIMFFVPSDEEGKWGENQHGSPIFSTTSDVEPVTTCFIVVPKWSDGSFGPYVPAPAASTAAPETHRHR